jgi:hypothetical protein
VSLVGVMNNTKWDELRLAMYELGGNRPQFQIKCRDIPTPAAWDGEWYYHFRGTGYEDIEWVDLRVDSPERRQAVRDCLVRIQLPGYETTQGFRIIGWVKAGSPIEYIR